MPSNIDYTQIKGIEVFLELRSTRLCAGHLSCEQHKYVFVYDARYLDHKKAIPLGPELPLTRQSFESENLFPSFLDRIPSKQNPAYPDYCRTFNIAPEEKNLLVLLATVGRKGPSSFICEPVWSDTFSAKDLKAFRKALGLSTRDFALCFGITQAALVRVEGRKASGTEILKTMEIFDKFPKVADYYIRKYATALHSKTKEKVLKMLNRPFGWSTRLREEEFEFSKSAAQELSKVPWAEKLLKDSKIKEALNYTPDPTRNSEELIRQRKAALFEVRFALAIHKAGRKAEYEYNTGIGKSSIDFKIQGRNKDEPDWLVELTGLTESNAVKENTFNANDPSKRGLLGDITAENAKKQGLEPASFDVFSSTTFPWDEKNSPEVRELKKVQNAILNKVTKQNKEGIVIPIKFPEPSEHAYHAIIVDMRGFLTGKSDTGDYINILYGSITLGNSPEYQRYWMTGKGERQLMLGIFDPNHPDPRCRYLQERIHAVGFICERDTHTKPPSPIEEHDYREDMINNKLILYSNPKFFDNDHKAARKLWPLSLGS